MTAPALRKAPTDPTAHERRGEDQPQRTPLLPDPALPDAEREQWEEDEEQEPEEIGEGAEHGGEVQVPTEHITRYESVLGSD